MALGISAFTLFGGHAYNRRWRRAVAFSVALALWIVLYSVLGSMIRSWWILWTVGIAGLWAFSGLVSYLDAQRAPVSSPRAPLTPAQWIFAVGLSALGVLVLSTVPAGWIYRGSVPDTGVDEGMIAALASRGGERRGYLGATSAVYGTDFDPSGDGVIVGGRGVIHGRVTWNDRPCSGVRLRLLLAKDSRSPWVVSEEDGAYEIPVSTGRYTYYGFELDKRNADVVLAGQLLREDRYRSLAPILVAEDAPTPGPDFEFSSPSGDADPFSGRRIPESTDLSETQSALVRRRIESFVGGDSYRVHFRRNLRGA